MTLDPVSAIAMDEYWVVQKERTKWLVLLELSSREQVGGCRVWAHGSCQAVMRSMQW